MSCINIVIHYANDPPFTSKIRSLVEACFATCFDTLKEEQAFITWSLGMVPDSDTGRNRSLTEWHINLNNALSAPGVAAQSAGYESNINVKAVKCSAAAANGDDDIAMANTIAHEIGVHVIADYDWTHPDVDSPFDIANDTLTAELCNAPGFFSRIVCNNMRIEFAALSWFD